MTRSPQKTPLLMRNMWHEQKHAIYIENDHLLAILLAFVITRNEAALKLLEITNAVIIGILQISYTSLARNTAIHAQMQCARNTGIYVEK